MSLQAKPSPSNPTSVLEVTIPPTRSDILHACDIMEDAAIAYSYNKIKEPLPKSSTIAVPLPVNKLSDLLRKECAFAGFTEALAFTLCSHDENFKFLRKVDGGGEAVVLANPKTLEYQVFFFQSLTLPLPTLTINVNRLSVPPFYQVSSRPSLQTNTSRFP